MSDPTENTVNDLMASYLRSRGIKITSQPSVQIMKGRRIPDFEVLNGGFVYGEGEWDNNYVNGLTQAIEFGDIPGSSGYFLIGYPNILKKKITQKRIVTVEPKDLLSGVIYRGIFKLKGESSSLFRGNLDELPDWLKDCIKKRVKREPDEFVKLMRNLVHGLTNYLTIDKDYPDLFEHIIAAMPKNKGELETAKRAAAYLLLNQIVFYRILSGKRLEPINVEKLNNPTQLYSVYFKKVVDDIDYNAIFDFDVASLFPKKSTRFIKDMVLIVNEIRPEEFTRDLLGNIFHTLIPLEVRKPVAAYYTNPMAARLLANLAIDKTKSTVADFACGCGTLLVASYDRKANLRKGEFTEMDHKKFIENDLTGIDIMPFAAHLAVIQLALKNPDYWTDQVRIGIRDSTSLKPKMKIKPLEKVLARGQQSLKTFLEENIEKVKVQEGAVSGKGAGKEFVLNSVDVVMMNPPFTRQEKIPTDLKYDLEKRFKNYKMFIHPQMGLRAYFILLADRFLKPNGRMAFVLPATTLRVESMRPIRKMIASSYDVEYIITTDFRSAFSESTSLREILIVAKKRKIKNKFGSPCIVTNLKVMPNENNIPIIEKNLKHMKHNPLELLDSKLYQVRIIEQKILSDRDDDWFSLLPSFSIIDDISEAIMISPNIIPLREIINPAKVKRCDYPSVMHIAQSRNAKTKEKGNIINEDSKRIIAKSKMTGSQVSIPISSLKKGLWSPSGLKEMDFTDNEDRIITKSFKNDENYFSSNVSHIIKKWKGKLSQFESDFMIPRKIDFQSSGTFHLAITTSYPCVPSTSIWGFGLLGEKGKILTLYFNSTPGIIELLNNRIEIRGAWSQFSKDSLLSLHVVNINNLPQKDFRFLLDTFNKVSKMPFPSLLEQLRTSFSGLIEIDKAIFKTLKIKEYEDENKIIELHQAVANEIERLKIMMGRDHHS